MSSKTYISDAAQHPNSQIGATLDALFATIAARREADADKASESYTRQLLDGPLEKLLKKVSEETLETCLAAKECDMFEADVDGDARANGETDVESDINQIRPELGTSVDQERYELDASIDHMRYEAADVIYHLLVLLARFGIDSDELAAELNYRMREEERPEGCVLLHPEHVRRGK